MLTPRARQVLTLVADGLTDAQIARRLGISPRTVSKHLERTYATLGVTNRVDALRAVHPAVARRHDPRPLAPPA
jgi:DNA-binding CsgD family transcriptional regulator